LLSRANVEDVAAMTGEHRPMGYALAAVRLAWAFPWTAVGLLLGLVGLVSGGRVQRWGRTLEFHGGWLTHLLRRVPIAGGAAAMTLGHVVLARTAADLARCRSHEQVHVAQYERWGPLFVPAYLACSAWCWLRGRDAYHDNPFERAAFEGEYAAHRPPR
jgi:hypothetical protein